MAMQGMLWKWTNYYSGWQSRWFVLDNGTLSYYKSQEDVVNGCKGSISMSVCDVTVHPKDPTRLDLSIPGEAYFYVRAASQQERQEWLVALGSCKAAIQHTGARVPQPTPFVEIAEDELKAKKSELRLYCDLLMQQVHSVKSSASDHSNPDIQRVSEASSLLSATCDTFIRTLDECMQLVNAAASEPPHSPSLPAPKEGPPTPTRKLSKATSSRPQSVQRQPSRDSAASSSSTSESIIRGFIPGKNKSSRPGSGGGPRNSSARSRQSSSESVTDLSPSHSKKAIALILESGLDPALLSEDAEEEAAGVSLVTSAAAVNVTAAVALGAAHTSQAAAEGVGQHSTQPHTAQQVTHAVEKSHIMNAQAKAPLNKAGVSTTSKAPQREGSARGTSAHGDWTGSSVPQDVAVAASIEKANSEPSSQDIMTFFNTMPASFADVKLLDNSGIPTEPFLNACTNILPIFDKLNQTAFAPIKMEFTGNVMKIKHKYSTDPVRFTTLQNIIQYEVAKQHHVHANSATNSLLWLKRGLDFLREFLMEFMTGSDDLQQASFNAYARSLKPYHSYVVRGVFALAAKSAPTRQIFIHSLAGDPSQLRDVTTLQQVLLRQIEHHVTHIDQVLKVIGEFYRANQLQADDVEGEAA